LEAKKGILGIRWRQMVNVMPQLLYPWKEQEAGCLPGPVWTGMERIKFLASTGIGILQHHPVVCCCTTYTILTPIHIGIDLIKLKKKKQI